MGKSTVQKLKNAASAGLDADQYISTDDVITAYSWRALCTIRCEQLGLTRDSEEMTTCIRAFNFRQRTDPTLGVGYCANGVSHVWTELTVRELLSMTPSAIATLLRASIRLQKPETIAARAQWLLRTQEAECKPAIVWDRHALSAMISSWGFAWQEVDFNAPPVCFDHGALTPLVVVIVPRPHADG